MQTKVDRKEYMRVWARNRYKNPEARTRLKENYKRYYYKPEVMKRGKNKHLMETYGISLEQKIEWMKKECPIGNHSFKDVADACVDHDHKTGKVRGLLCREHNRGLGHFDDSIAELEQMIDYLRRHNV